VSQTIHRGPASGSQGRHTNGPGAFGREAAGLQWPSSPKLEGVSLLPAAKGYGSNSSRVLIGEMNYDRCAFSKDYRYVEAQGESQGHVGTNLLAKLKGLHSGYEDSKQVRARA